MNAAIGLVWVVVCVAWFRNNPSEMKGISSNERNYIENNRRFTTHKQSFPWGIAIRSRSLWALVGQLFCSQWAQYFFIAWMPVYLQEGRHFSESSMKMITSYFFIIGMAGVLSAGFLSDWLVKRKGLKFGRIFLGTGALSLLGLCFLVMALSPNNTTVILCLFMSQLFYSFIPLVSFSTCVDIGGNCVGTVAGTMNFFGQMGAFFLAVAFGKIVDVMHSFSAPMFVISAMLFTGSVLWLLVNPSRQIIPTENKIAGLA
jgi:sugar phosphate permease